MTSTELIKHDAPTALPSNRKFGGLFVIVFALVGVWPALVGSREPRYWAFALALAFLTFTVVAPDMLEPLNKIWMRIGELLHAVVSPLVLGLVFFGVVTPIAALQRLRKKDILKLQREPALQTYWIERQPPGPRPETLPRQF